MKTKLRSLKWFEKAEEEMMKHEHGSLGEWYKGYKEAMENILQKIKELEYVDGDRLEKLRNELEGTSHNAPKEKSITNHSQEKDRKSKLKRALPTSLDTSQKRRRTN